MCECVCGMFRSEASPDDDDDDDTLFWDVGNILRSDNKNQSLSLIQSFFFLNIVCLD